MWWGIPMHLVPSWGDGVQVVEEEMGIKDQDRNGSFFALNQVGLDIALQIDGKKSINDLLLWFQMKYKLEREIALLDLLRFIKNLNRALLINFQGDFWYIVFSCLYQTLQHCWKMKSILPFWSAMLFVKDLCWRERLHWEKRHEIIHQTLYLGVRILSMWFPLWILISFMLASIPILTTNNFLWKSIWTIFLIVLFFPLCISIHEISHLVALGQNKNNKRILTLRLTGIFVILPSDVPPSRIILSSLAGPFSNFEFTAKTHRR